MTTKDITRPMLKIFKYQEACIADSAIWPLKANPLASAFPAPAPFQHRTYLQC